MITYIIYDASYKKAKFKISCLSTDEKPSNSLDGLQIKNGSILSEIDTGTQFMYDEDGGQWHEIPSSGGSGGGGGSDEQWIQLMNKTIESFEAPKGATAIPADFFYGCTSLTNVSFSNTIKTIGEEAFRNCTSLRSIDIPGNIETLESEAFAGCTKLAIVTLHDGLLTIKGTCFQSCPILSLTIPETVTSLGSGIGTKIDYVTMLSKIPPQIQVSTFYKKNIKAIYVPAESVDAYKTATNWTNFAYYIQPISE